MFSSLFSIWGNITNPYSPNYKIPGTGIGNFLANLIRVLMVVAGIYAVFNFVLAGYGFLGAGGDPKKIADAWAKIWQTLIGLVFVFGAFIIAAIVSQILYGRPNEIFTIMIWGP